MIDKKREILLIFHVTFTILFISFIIFGITINIRSTQALYTQNNSITSTGISKTGEIVFSQPLNFTDLTIADYNHDNVPEFFIVGDKANSTIFIIEQNGSQLVLKQSINSMHFIKDLEVGDLSGDDLADLAFYWYGGNGYYEVFFQRNDIPPFNDVFDYQVSTGTPFPKACELSYFFEQDRMNLLCFYGPTAAYYYNSTLYTLLQRDFINIFLESDIAIYPIEATAENLDNQGQDEVIIYGQDIDSHKYFLTLQKSRNSLVFNTTLLYANLTGSPSYSDFVLADVNGDHQKDIIAVNSTGIFTYLQLNQFKYSSRYNLASLRLNLKQIEVGKLNNNPAPDIVVSDETHLFIYYDIPTSDPAIMLDPDVDKITDFAIYDINNDGFDDIALIGIKGNQSHLILYYSKIDKIPDEKANDIAIGAASTGALAGVTLASGLLASTPPPSVGVSQAAPGGGDPLKLNTGTQKSDISTGIKTPSKWFKRKTFKMSLSSLLIGTGTSVGLLYSIYPVALQSDWLVWFSAIIGPIGFFYGVYDLLYVGFYQYKGNLWNAYYKGKTKFFWDALSWTKPVLTFYCIYTTAIMFLTLTFSDLLIVLLIFGILFLGMVVLLLFAIMFKVGATGPPMK